MFPYNSITGKIICCLLLFLLLAVAFVLASIPLSRLLIPDDLPAFDNSVAIAIGNVNLITMNGNEVKKDQQLLIRDGLIEAINPAGTVHDGSYKTIDAAGAWLVPGLFDMHVHVFDRKYQLLNLAHGVTSVRNMGGYPMHLRWKKELDEGRWLGSNLFISSPILNGEKFADPLSHIILSDPEQARQRVRQYKQAGWDFIKIYESMDADVYEAVIDEAAKQSIAVVGHLPYSIVNRDYSQGSAMRTLEHAEEIFDGPLNYEFDEAKLEATAKQLKSMNATLTPTLMIFDHLTRLGNEKQAYVDELPLQYLNPFVKFVMKHTDVNRWLGVSDRQREHNVKLNKYLLHIVEVLHSHHINLVLGSDSGIIYTIPGLATHEEMALMYRAGLSPWEILRTGTINAARAAGVENNFGSIEVGKTADLILLNKNPLFDIGVLGQPSAVIKRGQWLSEEDLAELKTVAENSQNAYLTMGHVLEFLLSK
jgi:amidohydrolase family protein